MNKLILSIFLVLGCVLAEAHPAWGIVVDDDRNIYFADIGNNGGSVWKLSPNGQLTLLIDQFHAHNVCLDSDGNVITAHGEGNHTMVRIRPNGAVDTLFHTHDLNEFFGGNCTYTAQGEIIYGMGSPKRLIAIDSEGNRRTVSDFEFQWNQTMYAAADGTIYAPDIGIDNGVLVKIEPDGKATIIARDLISKLDRPKDKHNDILLGITDDDKGNVYIAELAGQRVIRVLENGETDTYYKSDGDWFPAGIDFQDGDAFILEFRNGSSGLEGPRVTRLNSKGKKSVLFNYQDYQKGAVPTSGNSDNSNGKLPRMLTLVLGLVILYFAIRMMISYME